MTKCSLLENSVVSDGIWLFTEN